MGDLTKNFSAWEFQCPCCGHQGMNDLFLHSLQQFRDLLNCRLNTTGAKGGGFRCPTLQAEMVREGKSSSQSMHARGMAADLYSEVSGCRLLFENAFSISGFLNGGVIWYRDRGFVHVDCRGEFGRPPLRWLQTDKGLYQCHNIGSLITRSLVEESEKNV